MLFNSIRFAIFFPIVTAVYFATPYRMRWIILLVASCVFYMAFVPIYIFILLLTVVIDYTAAICIERSQGRTRRMWLIVSIMATCAVLFVFKYFNFFNDSAAAIAHALDWNYSVTALKLILPIGLSFHTFQSLSYVIEVYRGKQAAERHFGIYFLYVMFYPQLVAGPIERPQNLLHQFREEHDFDPARVSDGLKLIAWGFFKKVVIADRLALLVATPYGHPESYPGIPLLLATVLFAFQIYCDFSGYSDIAIGTAQVMGFRLMTNFNRPYHSRSVAEFWKRWHISLSTWFKDYLYIPLGGNRRGHARWYRNIIITFLISGLWHGANWTYVAWGALHATYLVIGALTAEARRKLRNSLRISEHGRSIQLARTLTTFILVTFAWIFFRSASVRQAEYIVMHLFAGLPAQISLLVHSWSTSHQPLLHPTQDGSTLVLGLLAIVALEIVQRLQAHGSVRHFLSQRPPHVRWATYYAIALSIMFFGVFNRTQFIYFQF